jgi:hypothetical protein
MSKIFETLRMTKAPKSAFDLSHERKLSMNLGDLVPIYMDEILPGDEFEVATELMARMAPMLAPIQHRVNVYVHYFFVPNRILWEEWEDFITGGKNGNTTPTMPTLTWGGASNPVEPGDLADYLGLPLITAGAAATYDVSQLPFRAYQAIYNDYFRDETLNSEVDITLQSEIRAIRRRAWEKDYFTSCLPWTQRGPEVDLPITVDYKDISDVVGGDGSPTSNLTTNASGQLTSGAGGAISEDVRIENLETEGFQVSINELRTSSALQRWLEKQARGGYRYIETILSHFGVRSSDSRLQRPEYLGGGRQPMVISEVLNTTGTTEAPQGDMTGHGISVGQANRFRRKFEEHGFVMGIMSVLPRTAYQQGIHRLWSRSDKTEYYWPSFANLGEQAVLNKEIYHDATDADYNEGTFGYQQRYAEYKHGCSSVHGEYKTTLDFWHMGRIFSSQPVLDGQFVTANPTNRIFAATGEEQLYVQVYNNVKARRPMPYFANPQLR